MKTTLAGSTVALLGLTGMGCGGASLDSTSARVHPSARSSRIHGSSRSVTRSVRQASASHMASKRPLAERDHDGDPGPADDEIPNSLYDGDDGEIRYYGHAAGELDRRAVTALVNRYYAAVAADDGATACSLIAANLVSALIEEDGTASHRGHKTCAAAMTKLFEHVPGRSPADFTAVEVTGVRVRGEEGLALLRLRTSEVRDIPVGREGGAWKVNAFFDNGLS